MSNDPKGNDPKKGPDAPAGQSNAQAPAAPAVAAAQPGEDWQEDFVPDEEQIDPSLAGLYKVTHGTLYFAENKSAATGRKVRLTARDAKMFLEQGLVERVSA